MVCFSNCHQFIIKVSVDCSNYRTTLIYANVRKLELNRLSPIGLLPGVNLAWSYCLKLWNRWNKNQSKQLSKEVRSN